ncbi:MAG: O-antigen ligase family protein [Alphaproteobacteria bacterium]|nr:O-antigen ligase family protein [Alphaproteobacteria bacterium]
MAGGNTLMSVPRIYLAAVGVLLIGYAVFNKGFAYLGYPPVFIGEVFLAFSIMVLLTGAYSARIFGSPIVWAMLLFMVWGAARTFPFVQTYGLDAIRDSVIWLYALYGIFVGSALLRAHALGLVPRWYMAWFPWFLVLAPIFFLAGQLIPHSLPAWPGSGRLMISMKPGDMSVHLAGVAAFLGLGLHRHFLKPGQTYSHVKEFALWMIWGAGVIAAGSRNRGGLLSVMIACIVILAFKPASRINRVILPALVVILLAVSFDVSVPVGGGRNVSVQQIIDNFQSVFFKSKRSALSDTASWRILWWQEIRDDTVYGDYFWNGRGFGENLSEAHGFADHTGNRSPHNGHLTILSRAGVPGLAIWLVFLSFVAFSLIQGYFRMRAIGHNTLANLNLWAFAYWMAFLVNASFDVYLEGPQGGIWFWSLVGFVIALTMEQRQLYSRTVEKQRISPRVSMGRLR